MKWIPIMFSDPLRCTLLTVVCIAPIAFSGCADVGGGAFVEPEVTFLPADLGGDTGGADTAEAGGTTVEVSPSAGSGPGTFAGRVVMTGGGPKLALLFVKDADIKDKEVCAEFDVVDERLILGPDNGVKNVFVFMKKAPRGTPKMEPPAEDLVFDQKSCTFLPHCMIVPVGHTLRVKSGDNAAHNTHTNPAKNTSVSSVVSANDREGELQLIYTDTENPFSVTCDFHTWMKAWHLPLDHPYGAVTDENGKFEIKNIPAGTHEFVVWHESAAGNYIERKLEVTVNAGAVTEREIEYPKSKLNQ